jgi:hypothetical protein
MPSQKERAQLRAQREAEALQRNQQYERQRHGARVVLPVRDGCAFVVSDQHYFPDIPPSIAHRASVVLARKLRPYAVISNGDAIDGASISRWPVSSFTEMSGRPTVAAELKEAGARLRDYERLTFIEFLVWNLGNHDARFETRLAEKVPEYAGVDGFTLKERFPAWLPAWRTDFCVAQGSDVPLVVVKHRFKGGMHAGQNNALWAGTSIVTGHDHMLKDYPISTVGRQIRWGIHAGTMAPIDSPFFTHYTEDNIVNWHEGFVVLNFRGGMFVGPEYCRVFGGKAYFRGEEIKL